MTEKTSVEHLPNMDKKQCNDYDMTNTGKEKQKFEEYKPYKTEIIEEVKE